MRSRRVLPAVLLLPALAATAQVALNTGPVVGPGVVLQKAVVRASDGTLYALTVTEVGTDRPLLLQTSTDGGHTWAGINVMLNDATSGRSPPNATNVCALAIDSTGLLHVRWGSFYYPSYYKTYYRNYHPGTAQLSAIVDVSAMLGRPVTNRTAEMGILCDAGDYIWMVAQNANSWQSDLLRSDLPSAQGLTFTNYGSISPSASSQNVGLAVDIAGQIHTIYYRNIGAGDLEHRIYTPGTGWGTQTTMGNTTPTNDYFGTLAADLLGNVHALYVMDALAGSTWLFRYKRWDAANGWSPEVVLYDATPAQYGSSNAAPLGIACNENTGTAWIYHRDYSAGGSLRLARKALADPGFTYVPDLTQPSAGTHDYYLLGVRGSLYPTFNQTGTNLDLTFRHGTAAPYTYVFQRVPTGTDLNIRVLWPPRVGITLPFVVSSSSDAGLTYACGFALGSTPGILLPSGRTIPLNPDLLLILSLGSIPPFMNTIGVLDAAGNGFPSILVPNDPVLAGFTFYGAFVTLNAGSPDGIRAISFALPTTFML